jgi:hypothetical protein
VAGFQKIKKLLYLDTYGWMAVASLLICAVSGVFLAIPYDVKSPYESITKMLIANAPASFVRNLHYWSAQLFLIFSVLHVYDHFKRSTENNIPRRGIWFRLTLSIAFIVYVMISGFILKADNDSQQARRILSTLLESIPLLGKPLQQTFIGPENSWQIIYIQHVATATIIIFLAVFEHAKTVWVKMKTFVIVFAITAVLSAILRAPFNGLNENVMKGPWYFVGLQEVLHWLSFPWIIMAVSFILLIIIYFIPSIKAPQRLITKKFLLGFLIIYGFLTIIGLLFRGENWMWQWPWQKDASIPVAGIFNPFAQADSDKLTDLAAQKGKKESCLLCHEGMKGLSESHSEQAAGCYSCHLGDPYSAYKEIAHMNMVSVPGNLSNASKTCGTANCHPQIVPRVNNSLMATLSGIITVDRFVFGETHDLNEISSVNNLGYSAAGMHLRNLCAGCHLGNEKLNNGAAAWLERGGGCNACHLTYDDRAQKELLDRQKRKEEDGTVPRYHPAIDLNITNDKCLSCHSRSGRISMNYEGWHETTLKDIPPNAANRFRKLPDDRVFTFISQDVHHEKGLSCIDCHGSYELMGDGHHYAHKEQAVKVSCEDCHPAGKPNSTTTFEKTDRETQLIAWLRKYETKNTRIIKTADGELPLSNTTVDNYGRIKMTLKLSGAQADSKFQAEACSRGNVHERLSCNACHTAWAPQCIGCHNSYEKQTEGFDMLRNIKTNGSWVEYAGEYFADEPVLGIDEKEGKRGKVLTMIPGMIMTIDKSSYKKGEDESFHRLYAPASAHTTRRESRSCKSCHNNPLTIGYGRGRLAYSPDGKWQFEPKFEKNSHDGLPEDAWTAFLKNRTGAVSARKGVRPFNIEEQKHILTAGACLTCHDENSGVMTRSLTNFSELVKARSSKCVLPVW